MNINDRVEQKGFKGTILSIKHDPFYIVKFDKIHKPLLIYKYDLKVIKSKKR